MVKQENSVDVEEGEISDAMSIEEISEEDFKKQDVKETKEASKPKPRVWTMQDLYKYQVEKGYTSGLHNLAWAQAVQKKPLSEVVMMEVDAAANGKEEKKGDSVKGVDKVVIDDSGDEGDARVGDSEKEEGELEEGEIDLDSEAVDKVDGEGGEASLSADSVTNGGGECDMELGEEEVERRLHLIQEDLDSVISSNAEM